MVNQVRVCAIGLTVYAPVSRAFVIRVQQRLLYASLIRFDDVVLGLEFHDLADELHVRHALSVLCKWIIRTK